MPKIVAPGLAMPLLAAMALAACATTSAPSVGGTVHVRDAMLDQVNPAIMVVWDIGNNAMNDAGGLDPAQMDAAKWTALAGAAGDLAQASETIATATQILAASPGRMETGEFEVSMAQVQAMIDADPVGFREEAARFAVSARQLQAAATTRDIATASTLVAGMDGECAACHARFWYAE